MQFRKGDVVSVQGTVKHNLDDGETSLAVDLEGHYQTLWIPTGNIKLIRQTFEVGDWVLWDGGFSSGECGEVVGISGDHAWIDMGSGNYCTRHFGAIERGPQHPTEGPDAVV